MPIRLLSVEVFNVGPFGRRLFNLDSPFVGIVGQNGSGKSTLLSVAHYALTGDLNRLGRGGEAINADRRDKEQPYVRLTLSPTGDPADVAVVTRWLPDGMVKGRRRLVHADRVITADAEIGSLVSAWVGMTTPSIGDFVFVAQGRTAEIIDDRPARRAELMQRVFSVGAAEPAREAIFLAIKDIPSPPDRDVAAQARVKVVECQACLDEIDKRLSSLPVYPADVLAAATAVVAQAARRDAIYPALREAEGRVARLEQQVKAALPPDPGDPSDLERLVAQWKKYRQDLATYEAAQTAWEEAQRHLAKLQLAPAHDPGEYPPGVPEADVRDRKSVV